MTDSEVEQVSGGQLNWVACGYDVNVVSCDGNGDGGDHNVFGCDPGNGEDDTNWVSCDYDDGGANYNCGTNEISCNDDYE